MLIVPNNKLSNHYGKKKVKETVWLEDQTFSSSFRQNMETMQEKTKNGMFYEECLNPVFSFSSNVVPDFYADYSSYPSMLNNGSMMNVYDNHIMGIIEGLNSFVGGDIKGLGSNNNVFVDDGLFIGLADCQTLFFDWTVMSKYNVNSETQTQNYTFYTGSINIFDAGKISSLTIGLSTGVSIPTLSWEGITYNRLIMNIGSQTYMNIESGWNSFEFIKSVDSLTWAIGQAIGFDAKVAVKDAGGETTTITLHRDGLFDKAWDFLTEIWNQIVGAVTAAVEFAKNMLNAIRNWVLDRLTEMLRPIIGGIFSIGDTSGMKGNEKFVEIISDLLDGSCSANDVINIIWESLTSLNSLLITLASLVIYAFAMGAVMMFAITFMMIGIITLNDLNDVLVDVSLTKTGESPTKQSKEQGLIVMFAAAEVFGIGNFATYFVKLSGVGLLIALAFELIINLAGVFLVLVGIKLLTGVSIWPLTYIA